jgi:uncharacterized protein YbjT (DUF2867 family)
VKIVVIGGSGLIGSKVVLKLREQGHEAVPASRKTGVDTITGAGLAAAMKGADVVVDASDSPSFEEKAVMNFFRTSTTNLLAAEATAGVRHHVALSVVGRDRRTDSGYMRAKGAQANLIEESSIPYTIVQATQFFEFMKGVADSATDGDTVRLAPVLIQPIAADDVAAELARVAVGAPVNGIVEIAGPEEFRLDELVRRYLTPIGDRRSVIADPNALYFGGKLQERTLVPGKGAIIAETRFEDWLSRQSVAAT